MSSQRISHRVIHRDVHTNQQRFFMQFAHISDLLILIYRLEKQRRQLTDLPMSANIPALISNVSTRQEKVKA